MTHMGDQRQVEVALNDGSTVHVRPALERDRELLRRFGSELSADSRQMRFFSAGADAGNDLPVQDGDDERWLIAVTGTEPRVVGHAGFAPADSERAEAALAVSDDFRRRGLGTILLERVLELAREDGVQVLEGKVLPENHELLDVLMETGYPVHLRAGDGVIDAQLETESLDSTGERFAQRERRSAVSAVSSILRPRSVAVIGASRNPDAVGGRILHNLLQLGYTGELYPVNPTAEEVQGVRAYPNVGAIPGDVEMAVIAVPAIYVQQTAAECAERGVRALVVISAGFNEIGSAGIERQRQLLQLCRDTGMRLVGPNCFGVLNMADDVRMNATFGPQVPPPGRIGFMSQSGALGLAVIDYAVDLGVGISSFISVGNKADISGNDLIQYWEGDDDTGVILLYLESFGNPRKFARIARRVGRSKPIVAVKSGRSLAGARATASHTGALVAASDVTVNSLFDQAGVVRTDTLMEMFDVSKLLAQSPPPAGRRVAIVTNAGGPAILCADACESYGLTVTQLPRNLRNELSEFLPSEASTLNPVDMIATASPDDFRRAISVIGASGAVDSIISIFIPPLATRAGDVARAMREALPKVPENVPLLSVFMTSEGTPAELAGDGRQIPSFEFPENAARALAAAARYGEWRNTPLGEVPRFAGSRHAEAAALTARALEDGPRWLTPDEIERLFRCYELPLVESITVGSIDEVAGAARELGGAVALKGSAPGLVHKTDAGAVALGLETPEDAATAAQAMCRRLGESGFEPDGFVVQRMLPAGVEMLVGVVHDPSFGPVLACGAGGTTAEVLKDVAVRITPLTDRDADAMIDSLRTKPLLQGYRGTAPANIDALRETILRVSEMVESHPEIAEMDCNPVIVSPDGAVIADARVRVERPRSDHTARVWPDS